MDYSHNLFGFTPHTLTSNGQYLDYRFFIPMPGGPDLNSIGENKVSKLNQLQNLFERITQSEDIDVIHATAQSGIELLDQMESNGDVVGLLIEELTATHIDLCGKK